MPIEDQDEQAEKEFFEEDLGDESDSEDKTAPIQQDDIPETQEEADLPDPVQGSRAPKGKHEHVSSAGNKIFETAPHENVGKVHKGNTTGAYIEVVKPRLPSVEAQMRAAATDALVASGEDGRPEHHDLPFDMHKHHKPSENPAINPNSPTQVGDTKETALAAAKTKIESGDASGPQEFDDEDERLLAKSEKDAYASGASPEQLGNETDEDEEEEDSGDDNPLDSDELL